MRSAVRGYQFQHEIVFCEIWTKLHTGSGILSSDDNKDRACFASCLVLLEDSGWATTSNEVNLKIWFNLIKEETTQQNGMNKTEKGKLRSLMNRHSDLTNTCIINSMIL